MAASIRSVDILGCRLDIAAKSECRDWLRDALSDPWNGRCRHIATLNPEYVMAARRDASFAEALRAADLATADGVGVVVAAQWLAGVRPERLTGVELTEWLAELSGAANAPIFLLGAEPGVADLAAKRLQGRFPAMQLAETWADGTPHSKDDMAALDRIASSGARIVAVAYGAPAQVHWIERNRTALAAAGVRAVIGVGGALDYLSGTARLPHPLIRRLGLEWLARLLREPWRWRRQLVLPVFAALVAKEAVMRRFGRRNR